MRQRWLLARGLCLVAALASASSVHAAPKKKPRAPKAAQKKPVKEESPKEEPAPEPEPVKLEEATPEPVKEPEPKAAPVVEAKAAPAVAPAAEEPAPAPSVADSDEARLVGERELARRKSRRILVAVAASVDVGNRRFSYSDPVGDGYAPYRLPAAPMVSFGLEAYPGAATGITVLQDLGFRGAVSRGFAFDSDTPQGAQLETSWTRFRGELRYRFPFPGQHPLELGAFAGADASYFDMTTDDEVPALLPAAHTVSLRFGIDLRVLIAWRLSLSLDAAYLKATTPGEIYERFRDPSVSGVDGELGLGVALGGGLELRSTGRYTRYFADFAPELGDPYVAGGAVDEQMQVGLGVRYAH